MNDRKEEWTLAAALEILQHPTVDSALWASAVEWLLLYGPPEIQTLLQQASGHAAQECFPNLQPAGFTENGDPCYNLTDLAKSLNISEDEAQSIITGKEEVHGIRQLFSVTETKKVQ